MNTILIDKEGRWISLLIAARSRMSCAFNVESWMNEMPVTIGWNSYDEVGFDNHDDRTAPWNLRH